MSHWPEHIAATTWHGRAGGIRNAFSYGVDYLLVDMDQSAGPLLLSRNRFNLYSVQDRHHGGPPGAGCGLPWAQEVFAAKGFVAGDGCRIALLAQPGFLGADERLEDAVSQLRGNAATGVSDQKMNARRRAANVVHGNKRVRSLNSVCVRRCGTGWLAGTPIATAIAVGQIHRREDWNLGCVGTRHLRGSVPRG